MWEKNIMGVGELPDTILSFFQVIKRYNSDWHHACYAVNDVFDIDANVQLFP